MGIGRVLGVLESLDLYKAKMTSRHLLIKMTMMERTEMRKS